MAIYDPDKIIVEDVNSVLSGEKNIDDEINKKAFSFIPDKTMKVFKQNFFKNKKEFLDISRPILVESGPGKYENHGLVRIGYTLEPLKASINKVKKISIIIGIIFVFLGIIIAVYMARMISVPINEMMQAMKKAENGDLRIRVNIANKDERGELGNSYNKMMDNLSVLVNNLLFSAGKLNEMANLLLNNAGISKQNIDEIGKNSEKISMGTADNAATVKQVDSAINQLADFTAKIYDNVDDVLLKSRQMKNSAEMGDEKVKTNLEIIEQIRNEVIATNKIIDKLSLFADQINDITNTIEDITTKINTLAYNATISALKAGGEAKEISIIAKQVRELGESSKVSARTISDLIGKITKQVGHTVDAIKIINSRVERGYELSKQSRKKLTDIVDNVLKVDEKLAVVGTAVSKQAQQTQEMRLAINNVSKITEDVSRKTNHTFIAVQEEIKLVDDLEQYSRDLKNQSDNLKNLMQQFKVK